MIDYDKGMLGNATTNHKFIIKNITNLRSIYLV